MTNLIAIATIMFSTNIVESLHPSGDSKIRVEVGMATVNVPGYLTNVITLSTNQR